MILFAFDRDLVLPEADDRADDADAIAGRFKHRALLDMGLEEADVARGVHDETRSAGVAGSAQGLGAKGNFTRKVRTTHLCPQR